MPPTAGVGPRLTWSSSRADSNPGTPKQEESVPSSTLTTRSNTHHNNLIFWKDLIWALCCQPNIPYKTSLYKCQKQNKNAFIASWPPNKEYYQVHGIWKIMPPGTNTMIYFLMLFLSEWGHHWHWLWTAYNFVVIGMLENNI